MLHSMEPKILITVTHFCLKLSKLLSNLEIPNTMLVYVCVCTRVCVYACVRVLDCNVLQEQNCSVNKTFECVISTVGESGDQRFGCV